MGVEIAAIVGLSLGIMVGFVFSLAIKGKN